jgi:hypothetical protein
VVTSANVDALETVVTLWVVALVVVVVVVVVVLLVVVVVEVVEGNGTFLQTT